MLVFIKTSFTEHNFIKILINFYTIVNEELVSNIGRGLCVLVGISQDDTKNEVDWM